MCTNHLPEIDDGSEAVWRRIRLIPFTVEISEADRDEGLKDKLQAEADAVLSWVIDGWAAYRRLGMAEPKAVLSATAAYQADSDAVGRFIEDECETGDKQWSAITSQLHIRWQNWAIGQGCPSTLSRIAFGRLLDAKGYPADQKAHGRPRRKIRLRHVNSEESAVSFRHVSHVCVYPRMTARALETTRQIREKRNYVTLRLRHFPAVPLGPSDPTHSPDASGAGIEANPVIERNHP